METLPAFKNKRKSCSKWGNLKARSVFVFNWIGIEHRTAIVDQKLRFVDIEMELIVVRANKEVLLQSMSGQQEL